MSVPHAAIPTEDFLENPLACGQRCMYIGTSAFAQSETVQQFLLEVKELYERITPSLGVNQFLPELRRLREKNAYFDEIMEFVKVRLFEIRAAFNELGIDLSGFSKDACKESVKVRGVIIMEQHPTAIS